MTQRSLLYLLLGAGGVLLVVGFAFSVHIEQGINRAAHLEATQQSPVPTPAALQTAKHKAA